MKKVQNTQKYDMQMIRTVKETLIYRHPAAKTVTIKQEVLSATMLPVAAVTNELTTDLDVHPGGRNKNEIVDRGLLG